MALRTQVEYNLHFARTVKLFLVHKGNKSLNLLRTFLILAKPLSTAPPVDLIVSQHNATSRPQQIYLHSSAMSVS